jgi:hypothetical protein
LAILNSRDHFNVEAGLTTPSAARKPEFSDLFFRDEPAPRRPHMPPFPAIDIEGNLSLYWSFKSFTARILNL